MLTGPPFVDSVLPELTPSDTSVVNISGLVLAELPVVTGVFPVTWLPTVEKVEDVIDPLSLVVSGLISELAGLVD